MWRLDVNCLIFNHAHACPDPPNSKRAQALAGGTPNFKERPYSQSNSLARSGSDRTPGFCISLLGFDRESLRGYWADGTTVLYDQASQVGAIARAAG